jgi:hypothetical protein
VTALWPRKKFVESVPASRAERGPLANPRAFVAATRLSLGYRVLAGLSPRRGGHFEDRWSVAAQPLGVSLGNRHGKSVRVSPEVSA